MDTKRMRKQRDPLTLRQVAAGVTDHGIGQCCGGLHSGTSAFPIALHGQVERCDCDGWTPTQSNPADAPSRGVIG
eukprot:670649-Amphidinium_carterae.1